MLPTTRSPNALSGLRWLNRPDYLVNRLRVYLWEKSHPDDPWIADEMVRILDEWLRAEDVGIEFGSGRSTPWLASRISHLVSIEHDSYWWTLVHNALSNANLSSKVDLRLIEFDPRQWKETPEHSPYVNSVNDVPDNSVDFVLVDGWARSYCALVGMQKLKPGGILVFDDIHSHYPLTAKRLRRPRLPPLIRTEPHPPHFANVIRALRHWRCIWVGNGKQDTALWVKPHSFKQT